MKRTYADECLERAEKATAGPWEPTVNRFYNTFGGDLEYSSGPEHPGRYENGNPVQSIKVIADAEFISHARTDVPELARRLKKACEKLREHHIGLLVERRSLDDLADKLEAPLEEK